MPKLPMDYSNTHFYKIVCKNVDIQDIYIGHTTCFKTRKNCHKRVCNNPNDRSHNLPLYKFIRANDGFDNFDMILMETSKHANGLEARARERELIEQFKPSLNTTIPYRSEEEKKVIKNNWTKEHAEEIKEYKHNWHMENKDRLNETKRQKYYNNREEKLQKCKKYIIRTI